MIIIYLFTSCTDENIIQDSDTIDLGDEVEVTFHYSVVGMNNMVTKTTLMSPEQQKKINRVDVIVYKVEEGTGQELFAYHRGIFDLDDNANLFKVRLAKSKQSEKYTFDFLFNMPANTVVTLLRDVTIGETTREQVQEKVAVNTFTITGNSYLPMWTTTNDKHTITHGMTFPVLHPIRSFALIDVGLNMDENDISQELDNFRLTAAYIGYGASKIYFIPKKEVVDFTNNVVIAPTPGGVSNNAASGFSYPPQTDDVMLGRLFIGEPDVNARSGNNELRTFSVIIGGYYKDNPSKMQYFRIDLMNPDDPSKKLDILRNHRYRLNILAVSGDGYTTPTLAAQGPANMSVIYELSVYGQGDINHVVYNGQNKLGVSQVYYKMDGTAGLTGEIKVLTDVAGGWRVTLTDENGNTPSDNIIKITPTSANTTSKETATFTLVQANTSNPKIYYATFTAGSLSIKVMILQNGIWHIYSDYQQGTMMRGDGDQYYVYTWGAVPQNLLVRAYSPDKLLVASYDTLNFNTTGTTYPEASPEYQNLRIMGNASFPMTIRQVEFVYSTDNGATWVPFTEGPQGKGHFWLLDEPGDFKKGRTGRMVALYNMSETLHWAQAMGIDPSSYNNAFFYTWNPLAYTVVDGSSKALFWRSNYGYTPTHQTGCATYYEEGYPEYPPGSWRLPSRYEMDEISNYHLYIGDLPVSGVYYWSSNEDTGNNSFRGNSYKLQLRDGDPSTFDYVYKASEPLYVRCVHGEPSVNPPD